MLLLARYTRLVGFSPTVMYTNPRKPACPPGLPECRKHTRSLSSNLARRPPQAPCRTSGADSQAPIGTAWLLPFRHGVRRLASSGSDGVCWKVGRPLALVACLYDTIRQIGYPRFIGLKSKRYAEVHRPTPLRSFWPRRSGPPCRSRAFTY